METEEPKDDEDELAALMVASTTVRKRKLEVGSAINTKRRKQLKDLAAFVSCDNASQREREQNLAANYYNKLKEQLDETLFDKIIKLLCNFDGTSEGVMDLFKEMSAVLPPSLAEEFLCFLTPSQAHLCGKFMDHLILSKITDFYRKFEMSFAKQPQMVRKFYDVLCQLASSENVSLQQVRDAVLPLLKSKSFLMEYFLQLFPAERPSDSIVLDDFEEIYLDGDCLNEEEIRLADAEEPSNCPCSCHPLHPTHCQRCSVKYINGRVYIQAGKILRSARVEFNGLNPTEALRRVWINSEDLTPKGKQSRKKPDILNQKDLSPVKHVSSPHMAATESEDESLETKTNNLSANKPKSARSLKLKFKSSEKLSTKGKNSKVDEVSEEMRIISDENAITDTPDCFLARRLSPMEGADSAVVGSLNFNNFLYENQNDASRQGNIESTLNFAVHSPLKKASICLDSFDSTSESIQSPIKLDQHLHVSLKRLEDDELLMTLNSKGVSSSESSDLPLELMNSSYESSKIDNLKQESSMHSSISESIFTTSVVNEMNLLLGSSNVNKMNSSMEPSHSGMTKNTENGVEKYSEPTLDSLTIDSFLNISNLDAKIDAFLTNSDGTKNLDAFLNDSSLENSSIDKNVSANSNEVKNGTESYLLNCKKNSIGSSNIVLDKKIDPALSKQLDKPVIKVDNNMDSLLNFIDEDVSEAKTTCSTELTVNTFEKSKCLSSLKEEAQEVTNEVMDLKEIKDVPLWSVKKEAELKIKEEVTEESNDQKGTVSNLECDRHDSTTQMIFDPLKLEKEEVSSVFESTVEILDDNKVSCRTEEPMNSLPECKVVPSSLMASKESVTVIDSVQSVSFICGEEGDENGKVTLFSAEAIEDKMPQDSNISMVSIPMEVAQVKFSNNQMVDSHNTSLKRVLSHSKCFPSPSEDVKKSGKSTIPDPSSGPSEATHKSDNLTSSDCSENVQNVFPSSSPEDTQAREKWMVPNSHSCLSKDSFESEKLRPYHSSSSLQKDLKESEKSLSDSLTGPSKNTQNKSEHLVSPNFSPGLSKDAQKIEMSVASDSLTGPSKDCKKSERFVSSDSLSDPPKDTQNREKLFPPCFPKTPSKEVQKSEETISTNSSSVFSKNTYKSGKLLSSDSSFDPSKDVWKSEKPSALDSVSGSPKDIHKSETLVSSDSSSGILRGTQNSEKPPHSGSVSGILKDLEKSEKLVSSDLSSGPLKDTQNREKFVSSNAFSAPSHHLKDTQKSEKLVSSQNQASEEVRQNDHVANSSADLGNKSKDQGNDWTMEEDKIILQTFQKDPDMEDIFSKIKMQLPERSLSEVQSRFYVLIELLEKMSHSSDDASKKK